MIPPDPELERRARPGARPDRRADPGRRLRHRPRRLRRRAATRRPTTWCRSATRSSSRWRAAPCERDMPVLGICRGMQLINVALGGTLIQHLPDDVGHEDHRPVPGSFDGSDHDVRLTPGLARRARRRRGGARHQVAPPPGRRRASATVSRSPATRRSTTSPRRSRRRTAGSCSASSGTPRPTRTAA